MTDRYRRDEYRSQRMSQPQNYPDMPRQPEQYADYSGQQGGWDDDDTRTRWRDSGQSFRDDFDDDNGARRSGGSSSWSTDRGSTQRSAGYRSGYGDSYDLRGRTDRSGRGNGRDERGFLDRAGDEIASWFGDDDAARRREQDHRGKGPSGYTRSDERIRDDANDRLTDDRRVDASNVTVTVASGEVTLDGTVSNREAKRRAEDCVEDISGVKHVQNNLRVVSNQGSTSTGSWSGTTA